jgi:hypothetical protein
LENGSKGILRNWKAISFPNSFLDGIFDADNLHLPFVAPHRFIFLQFTPVAAFSEDLG